MVIPVINLITNKIKKIEIDKNIALGISLMSLSNIFIGFKITSGAKEQSNLRLIK
jgi:hypothetical protein